MPAFTQELLDTNLLGIKSYNNLIIAERKITTEKLRRIYNVPINGVFDYEHLKSIHKFIFEDIYPFAGKDRTQTGMKHDSFGKRTPDGSVMWFIGGKSLERTANALFDWLKSEKNFFLFHTKKEFIQDASKFFIKLNSLHPFREGNGRVQRIFMKELAEFAGYKLDLGNVRADRMIDACISGMQGDLKKMEALIKIHISPCKKLVSTRSEEINHFTATFSNKLCQL